MPPGCCRNCLWLKENFLPPNVPISPDTTVPGTDLDSTAPWISCRFAVTRPAPSSPAHPTPTHPFLVLGKNMGPHHALAWTLGVFPSPSLLSTWESLKACSGLSWSQVKCCRDAGPEPGPCGCSLPSQCCTAGREATWLDGKGKESHFFGESKESHCAPTALPSPAVYSGPRSFEPPDPAPCPRRSPPHTLTFQGSLPALLPRAAFQG